MRFKGEGEGRRGLKGEGGSNPTSPIWGGEEGGGERKRGEEEG